MALFFEFYPSFCVQSFEKIQKYKNKGIISNNLEVSCDEGYRFYLKDDSPWITSGSIDASHMM